MTVAGALLGVGVPMTGGPALAQSAESDSVQARPRLDYESYGLSLDGRARGAAVTGPSPVQAFTRLEIDTGYDSNVQRTEDDPTASAFTRIRPGISLRVEGESTEAFATLDIESTRYARSSEDATDDARVVVGLVSRPDEDLGLSVSGEAVRGHLLRSDDNDLGPGFDRTAYTQYGLSGSMSTAAIANTPTRLTAGLSLREHDDTDGVDRSELDRADANLRARIGIGGSSDLFYFVQPGVNRTQYTADRAINVDSTRYDLAGGFTWDGSAVSSFTGFAGVSHRRFDEGDQDAQTSGLVGANGLWNVTPLMTLTGRLSVANEDTSVADATSALVTSAGLGIDYDPRENLILSASALLSNTDFDGTASSETRSVVGIGARYMIDENFYLGARVEHERESADSGRNDYDATTAFFRFGVKLCCLTDRLVDTPAGERNTQTVVRNVFR